MGLFGPKLTGEQKDLLRTVANTMNVLADRQKNSFEQTTAQIREFGANCADGQRAGIGRPMNTPSDDEIEGVRRLLGVHKELLNSTIEELRNIRLENWAPSKFGKTQEDWVKYWETQSQFIDSALRGLSPPEPLVDQPNRFKLNMFLSGLATAQTMTLGSKRIKA